MATFPVLTDNYLHLIFELDNPLVPVNLLAWAVEAFVTSSACLMDVWSWDDRSVEQKSNITMLYAPYVALGM